MAAAAAIVPGKPRWLQQLGAAARHDAPRLRPAIRTGPCQSFGTVVLFGRATCRSFVAAL